MTCSGQAMGRIEKAALRQQPASRSPCVTKAMPNLINLTGQRFGRLVVLRRAKVQSKSRRVYWLCVCDCGSEKAVNAGHLRSGTVVSCGCFNREVVTKHGKSNSPEFRAWKHMRQRCTNENNPSFSNYGARGIKVCGRWIASFDNFYKDMGPRPSNKHTLERIDNNKGYSPENCCWATRSDQSRNRRATVYVQYQGERLCLTDAARKAGVNRHLVFDRRRRGWPESALFLPKGTKLFPC